MHLHEFSCFGHLHTHFLLSHISINDGGIVRIVLSQNEGNQVDNLLHNYPSSKYITVHV